MGGGGAAKEARKYDIISRLSSLANIQSFRCSAICNFLEAFCDEETPPGRTSLERYVDRLALAIGLRVEEHTGKALAFLQQAEDLPLITEVSACARKNRGLLWM